jgi:hypothetical protein
MKLKCINDHKISLVEEHGHDKYFGCNKCTYTICIRNNNLIWYDIVFQSNSDRSNNHNIHQIYTIMTRTKIIYEHKNILLEHFINFDYNKPKSIIEIIKKTLELKQFL